jgi:serine/threonine-protein kinase
MNEASSILDGLSEEAVWRLEEACCRFEAAWQSGRRPRLGDFVAGAEGPLRSALLRELLRLEVHYRRRAGEEPSLADYQQAFPEAADLLPDEFAAPPPASRKGPPARPAPRALANGQARDSKDTDRNLLFGVLALQADLIDSERFARACALWAADKDRPLAQVLVDLGWLTPEDRADVERLLARKVRKHGGDVQASLAEAVGAPAAASLAGVPDAEVQASLAAARGAPEVTVDEEPRSAGSRYRVLRPHAVGGLGEVSVAEDVELHREVALKEIKEQHAHQEGSRRRFVLEAEITGGLEHPGVVPVYGLGVYPDGRPYYAMRLIKGDTLGAAVARFHAAPGAAFDALEFRQLLGRFVDVCQAVAYAHSRGVLHRDLKPANVMLGKFGETLVVDWGLAKVVGRPDGAAGPSEEATLRPSAGSDGVQTQAGSAVGTPAFMSPEQARGELDGLGPATDVYGLGATLYVLLTNQPPFQGKLANVLQEVQRGAWRPARQVNAAVPPALDAICRRAMALRPEERYASALELAGDLEHWLADEPVSAYPEPAGARLRRWVRKHPRRVTAAGVLLLATVVGLTAGAGLLEQRRREVQENFEIARKAIDKSVRGVSEEFWLDEPAMQAPRHKVLLHAHDYYEELLKKYPRDQNLRQNYAEVKLLLGELCALVGRENQGAALGAQARNLVGQARNLYEEWLRQAPTDQGLRFGLAHAHHALAELQLQEGVFEDGERAVDGAIGLLEALRTEEAENPSSLTLLASSYDLRATAKWYRGDLESGLADNREALRIAEQVLSKSWVGPGVGHGAITPERLYETDRLKNVKGSLDLLPRAYTNRGIMLSDSGRNAESAPALQEATAFYRWLVSRLPGLTRFRHGLALALLHSGHVQVELGRPARAEAALRDACAQMQRLCQDDPFASEYAATRLLAAGYLGEALFRSGRTTAAEGFLREVREQGEDVLGASGMSRLRRQYELGVVEQVIEDRQPGKSRVLRAQHARLLYLLGCLHRETGEVARGLEISREAQEKLERALQEAPGHPSLRSALLGNREQLALCRFRSGDVNRDACIAAQRRVVEARRDLAGPRLTRAPRFQAELAGSVALLASLLLEGGRPDEALDCVGEVLADHQRFVREERERTRKRAAANQLPADDPRAPEPMWQVYLSARPVEPDDLELRRQEALLLARQGAALAGLGRGPEAVKAVSQAIALTEGLLRGDPALACPPTSPGSIWLRCPPASPRSVWSFVAQELVRQEPEPCYLYDLACHLALASTLPGRGGLADPAGQAVQALRDLIGSGFDNAYKLRTDPTLDPLRERPDFKKLVGDLEARVKGK